MPVIPIHFLTDPRIAAYRSLKDRDLTREGNKFMAEGEQVVRRLISSRYAVESILCIERKAEDLAAVAAGDLPLYIAPPWIVNQIVGFKFHSGVMAVGLRGRPMTIDDLMSISNPQSAIPNPQSPTTLVICPKIANTDNLGSLIRVSAAFGADGMILGPESCDPFYRQSVRVSMGAAFSLNIIQSADLLQDLRRLKSEFKVELIATVLGPDAEIIDTAPRAPRMALLLGNESEGLAAEWINECDRKVTIPMRLGTDSLNVSVAAGVFLHHFTRMAPFPMP